jgi:6-phosphogluconolactonase (cycloisomerase 2 family)
MRLGIADHKMRRIALLLAVGVATTLGVVASATAEIRKLGSAYRIGGDFLVFSPNGRWLATLDASSGPDRRPLWVMSVNPRTGALRRVSRAPFAVGSIPAAAAFSPDSHLLAISYALLPSIQVFSVNSRTGTLRPVARWSDPMGPVNSLAFSPRGGLLAAEDAGTKTVNAGVSLLTVNRMNGALRYASRWVGSTAVSPILLSSGEISFNPRGNLLAVMTSGTGLEADQDSVTILSVKQHKLAPVAHAHLPTNSLAATLAFSPDGSLLATGNLADDSVSLVRVNQRSGAVHAVRGSPFQIGEEADSLAFSPDGRLLAVASPDESEFAIFSVIKSSGRLRPVPGSPFGQRVGDEADWIAFSPVGNLLAYGAGIASPGEPAVTSPQRVAIFSTVFCADPDQDGDCDSA